MHLKQDIKSVSYLEKNSLTAINSVNENHRAMIFTENGEPKAVLQDIESYE